MIRAPDADNDSEEEGEIVSGDDEPVTALQAAKFAMKMGGPKGSLEELVKKNKADEPMSSGELLRIMQKEMKESTFPPLDKGTGVDEVQGSRVLHSKGDWTSDHESTEMTQFQVRPEMSVKFKPAVVRSVIEKIIKDFLNGKSYSKDDARSWIHEITQRIFEGVKQCNYERYRFTVHVIIGEINGQGVHSASRSFWDPETDASATYVYSSNTMFCFGSVYGIYVY